MTDAPGRDCASVRPPEGDILIAAFCAAADEVNPHRLDARAIGIEIIQLTRSQRKVPLTFVSMVRSRQGNPNPFYTKRRPSAVFVSPSSRLLYEEVVEDTAVDALKGYTGEVPITHRLVLDLSDILLEETGDYTMTVTCPDGGTVIRHLTVEVADE